MQEFAINEEESSITGKVLSIFFQNNTNYYKVLLVQIADTENMDFNEKEIVVTGHFGQIQEDFTYRFFGDLTNHAKYGVQFNVQRYEEEKPKDESALIDYFSSDKFPGIGKVTAKKVVEALGNHAIEEIETNADTLKKVQGLTAKQRKTIISAVQSEEGTNKLIFFLQKNGLSTALSYKVMEFYRDRAMDVLTENPYQLIEDIENIGFGRADAFAENMGIASDDPSRLKAGIFAALQELCLSNGDTYAEGTVVLSKAMDILEKSRPFMLSAEQMALALRDMTVEKKLVQEEEDYFLPALYYAEKELSYTVEDLLTHAESERFDDDLLDKEIHRLEKRLNISYGKTQKEALKYAIQSPVFILTGGPGTGKTTVIQGIVELFSELHDLNVDERDINEEEYPVLLAAPTGRAAKRMNETTGMPSATIHRLLGLTGNDESEDESSERELKGKLLIIDEMSMVDTWLANKLFQAIPHGMHVILVGDRDQLPSVGPGQVLHDFLESKKIPAIELQEIYRQEDGSSIIPLAHHIKNNEFPDSLTVNQKDRSFFACSGQHVLSVVSTVVKKAIEKGFLTQDIQVLAPMYRGPAGIDVLNKHLQEIMNPNISGRRKEITFGDVTYRIGDKVLQLINDTESGVFNGDMGKITGITFAKESLEKVDTLTILFDQKEVTYTRKDWKKITLAYCVSIHKAQGSEFKIVILPLVSYFGRMLRKDLLYTAITRASEMLILCGEPQAYQRCVEIGATVRKTKLMERLTALLDTRESIEVMEADEIESSAQSKTKKTKINQTEQENNEPKSFVLTEEKIKSGAISPMIGMESITPFSISHT